VNPGKWITVTKGTTRATAVEREISVTLGTIEEVKILFAPGALGYVKVVLLHYEHQFLPEDPEAYISGDDYVFVFPCNKEIKDYPKIKVRAWNTATVYDHDIFVGIFLKEKAPGGGLLGAAKKALGMSE